MLSYITAVYKLLCGSRAPRASAVPVPVPAADPVPVPARVRKPRVYSDHPKFMVPWSSVPSDHAPARYRKIMAATDSTPRGVADYLFKTNKVSDEYYTPIHTWRRFLSGEPHTAFWEPFYGDGSGVQGLSDAGYTVVGQPGNFWDIDWANAPTEHILSNPPFSFKWLVIEELLRHRREFSLILPWQTFCENSGGAIKLRRLMQVYGGTYTEFKLRGKENEFILPNGSKKPIGCSILCWRF
jgi:hypothetical protein